MWKPGPASGRVLEGLVLAMASPLAAMGVTLGCFVRNLILYPSSLKPLPQGATLEDAMNSEGTLPGGTLADFGATVFFAALALIWIVALVQYFQIEPRSPVTIILSILAIAVFGVSAWGTWGLAYPVCNSF